VSCVDPVEEEEAVKEDKWDLVPAVEVAVEEAVSIEPCALLFRRDTGVE
jgi:hypothetical protein